MARRCLADWLDVAIGAGDEPAGRIVREAAASWRSEGKATVRSEAGSRCTVALANGTPAHCLILMTPRQAITHTSAPVGRDPRLAGEEIGAMRPRCRPAFVAGFEIAARRQRPGRRDRARLARTGVSAGLPPPRRRCCCGSTRAGAARAGPAATQTGGLTAPFGTMAKPFHAGRAAMDGIVAAQLAASWLVPPPRAVRARRWLDTAWFRTERHDCTARSQRLAHFWHSFPGAACHLTHPAKMPPARRPVRQRMGRDVTSGPRSALAEQITGGAARRRTRSKASSASNTALPSACTDRRSRPPISASRGIPTPRFAPPLARSRASSARRWGSPRRG